MSLLRRAPWLLLLFLAAPARGDVPGLADLLDRLASDQRAVREAAAKKIEALDEKALPALRKAQKAHPDADVRLRLGLLITAIETRGAGPVRTFSGHRGTVWVVAVSGDGKRLASGGDDRTVRIWDVESGKELFVLEAGDVVHAVALSPDGKRVLHAAGTILRLVDVDGGKALHELRGHTRNVSRVVFARDGKTALSGGWDGRAICWDLGAGKALHSHVRHGAVLGGLAFLSEGRVVTAGHDHSTRAWDLKSGKLEISLGGHRAPIDHLSLAPDGKLLATAGWDRTARVWDWQIAKELHVLTGHTAPVVGVAFSPDGRSLVTASHDRTLRWWHAGTGRLLHRLEGHTGPVWKVVFLPDGRHVASCAEDGTVRLWKLPLVREP